MKKDFNSIYTDVTKIYHSKSKNTNFDLNNDLPNLISQVETLIKPDFLFIMDLRSEGDKVIFEKNYNLSSDKGKVELGLIMNSIPENILEQILEIDRLSAIFTATEYKYPFQYRMNVGFPVNLCEDKYQYLLRIAMVISLGDDGLPYHALAFFRDITPLCKNKMTVEYFISGYDKDNQEMVDFKKRVTQIISYNLSLTNQEKRILKKIEEGKTSADIAEEFFISPSTVNTHRQNIIKKLEVNNSAAAVKKALELGIIE